MVTGADAALGAAPWSAPEDAVIIAAQARFGNKWMSVAALLPGRTANAIKNRWNATLLPRLRRQAASPQATGPLLSTGYFYPTTAAGLHARKSPPAGKRRVQRPALESRKRGHADAATSSASPEALRDIKLPRHALSQSATHNSQVLESLLAAALEQQQQHPAQTASRSQSRKLQDVAGVTSSTPTPRNSSGTKSPASDGDNPLPRNPVMSSQQQAVPALAALPSMAELVALVRARQQQEERSLQQALLTAHCGNARQVVGLVPSPLLDCRHTVAKVEQ